MRFIQVEIRSKKQVTHLTGGLIILILLCSAILINMTYAQVSLKPHEVKISSPTKGQQVQAGKALAISGTSGDNATSDCQVSVIVNGIKPYQNATATGSSGLHDFSKWSFMLTPKYTPVKAGQNKITAKYSCANSPSSLSHNSVNVTGVSTNITTSIVNTNQTQKLQKQQSLPLQTKGSGTNFTAAHATSAKTSVPVLSNVSPYSGGEKNNTIGALSVSIHVGKSTIHPGNKQTITLKASDANTTNVIVGAKVTGRIMDSSGSSKNSFDGVTDTSGEVSYSWTVGHNDATGKYKVDVQVSAPGYGNDTASKSFKVTSTPVSSSSNNKDNSNNSVDSNSGSSNNNSNNNNNNNDNHNHPSTIITIPHIHIPQIRIPFHLPFH